MTDTKNLSWLEIYEDYCEMLRQSIYLNEAATARLEEAERTLERCRIARARLEEQEKNVLIDKWRLLIECKGVEDLMGIATKRKKGVEEAHAEESRQLSAQVDAMFNAIAQGLEEQKCPVLFHRLSPMHLRMRLPSDLTAEVRFHPIKGVYTLDSVQQKGARVSLPTPFTQDDAKAIVKQILTL